MSETFNPYAQWLGISAAGAPNHYGLLGIEPFESDPQAIMAAAGRQMARVRGIRPGAQLPRWRQLLDELAEAKRCLTDPADKSRYDAVLGEQLKRDSAESSSDQREPDDEPVSRDATAERGTRLSSANPTKAAAQRPGMNLLPPSRPAPVQAATVQSAPIQPAPSAGNPADEDEESDLPPASGPAVSPTPVVHSPVAPTFPATPQPAAPRTVVPTMGFGVPGPIVPAATQFPPMPFTAPQPQSPPTGFPMPGPVAAPIAPWGGGYAGGMPPAAPFQPPQPKAPQVPMPAFGMPTPYAAGQYPQAFPQMMPPGASLPDGYSPAVAMPAPRPAAPAGAGPLLPPGAAIAQPDASAAAPAAPAENAFLQNLLRDSSSTMDFLGQAESPRASPAGDWQQAQAATSAPFPATPLFPSAVPSAEYATSPAGVDLADVGEAQAVASGPSRSSRTKAAGMHPAVIGIGLGLVAVVGLIVVMAVSGRRGGLDAIADSSNPTVADSDGSIPPQPTPPKHKIDEPPKSQQPDHTPKSEPPKVTPIAEPPKPTPSPPTTDPPKAKPPKTEPPKFEPPAPQTPEPPKTEPPKPPPVDPAQAARLRRTLAAARVKLGERNQAEAKALVATAAKLIQSPEQQEAFDRMDALENDVGQFWGAVHDSLAALKATDEIEIGSTKAIVVDVGPEGISIRVEGQARSFRTGELPSGLAVALARRSLDERKPQNKVFIGAFYAVDPKSDLADARREWNEAAAGGADVRDHVKLLLPLLTPEAAEPGGADMDQSLLEVVPDTAAMDKAEKKLQGEFDSQIEEATTPAKKAEFAKRLIDEGEKADNSARRYVMWRMARDLAGEAGRPEVMVDAVDHLGRQFRIDPLDMKTDALANYPPKNAAAGKAADKVAMELVKQALDAKRFAVAVRLSQLALDAARKTNNAAMSREAVDNLREVQQLAKDNGAAQ